MSQKVCINKVLEIFKIDKHLTSPVPIHKGDKFSLI